MKLSALVSEVAKSTGLTKDKVKEVLAATETGVTEAIKAGESVKVLGVTFSTREVAERNYPNPKDPSAGPTTVPAHTAPKVTIGKGLKEAVK
ncbi:IHF protein [Vibrio phage YC]|uniref:IHF protein n=1 Tax=Vibrio phage YC TaxID=2267403 RepID=A0A384ZSC1_9CAUD|nr:IHF protein [Vibrio phage YC]AXC34538.1 IHF protein [Vibrio phage YC]